MGTECRAFIQLTDPRKTDTCGRCGLPRHCHDRAEVARARDKDMENEFFVEVIDTAQRLTGIRHPGYLLNVKERLKVGHERYGDDAFMHRDNLKETFEETPDIAGYAVLELHRQRGKLTKDKYAELYQDLVAASAYGCVADWYARRAARRLAA